MTIRILTGDSRDVLKTLADASVDSIVTDPPYELTSARPGGRSQATRGKVMAGFMGLRWDGSGVAFDADLWRECLRVLKPGGHLLAFGGTRTQHRMVCAIEDAGFEIRDQAGWMYGSGFPKSLDVSKAIDKAAGAERAQVVGVKAGHERFVDRTDPHSAGSRKHGWDRPYKDDPEAVRASHLNLAPATEEAKQWQGWGTALKPAWEPVCVARKPLVGTVAENVLAYGTGALNIDGCRVSMSAEDAAVINAAGGFTTGGYVRKKTEGTFMQGVPVAVDWQPSQLSRWPANLLHDGSPEVVAQFPAEAGASAQVKGTEPSSRQGAIYNGGLTRSTKNPFYADDGSAARFFWCPKTSRSDRNDGLHGMPERVMGVWGGDQNDLSAGKKSTLARANTHPTVKPTELMRYLCRLVTPPGGTVLDPFAGSGSTLKAAELEGFSAIGIELDPAYVEIAKRRIASDAPLFSKVETA